VAQKKISFRADGFSGAISSSPKPGVNRLPDPRNFNSAHACCTSVSGLVPADIGGRVPRARVHVT